MRPPRSSRLSIPVVLAALALSACTTQYGPQGFWGDGYLERKIAANRWVVLFDASVFTPPDTVARYALYRCAEITIADHARYFVIIASGYVETHPTKSQPTLVDAPAREASPSSEARPGHSARLVIQTFGEDKPEDFPVVYDARELVHENATRNREPNKS
jgi:hypothetical protein